MKKKKKLARCPGCLQFRHRTEINVCLSVLEGLERSQYKYFKEMGIDSYETICNSDFEWACDECLQTGKAILANPQIQENTFRQNLAYADENKKCQKCSNEFVFNKEEKKQWYEVYRFNLDSTPVNCILCRREVRSVKSENKILSDIFSKDEKNLSLVDLHMVIDIYQKWQKPQKVNYYKALMKKMSHQP